MTRFLSIVSLIIPLALAADAPSDAPFRYPPAQQAWKRYQLRAEQVRREFDQRMKEARDRYVSDLDDAARKAAVDGNMEAVKEIAEGKEKAGGGEVVIKCLIDGQSEVRLFGDGIQFANVSSARKPSRITINGQETMAAWTKDGSSGPDTSAKVSASIRLDDATVSVAYSNSPDGGTDRINSSVQIVRQKDVILVGIADGGRGAGWVTLVVRY